MPIAGATELGYPPPAVVPVIADPARTITSIPGVRGVACCGGSAAALASVVTKSLFTIPTDAAVALICITLIFGVPMLAALGRLAMKRDAAASGVRSPSESFARGCWREYMDALVIAFCIDAFRRQLDIARGVPPDDAPASNGGKCCSKKPTSRPLSSRLSSILTVRRAQSGDIAAHSSAGEESVGADGEERSSTQNYDSSEEEEAPASWAPQHRHESSGGWKPKTRDDSAVDTTWKPTPRETPTPQLMAGPLPVQSELAQQSVQGAAALSRALSAHAGASPPRSPHTPQPRVVTPSRVGDVPPRTTPPSWTPKTRDTLTASSTAVYSLKSDFRLPVRASPPEATWTPNREAVSPAASPERAWVPRTRESVTTATHAAHTTPPRAPSAVPRDSAAATWSPQPRSSDVDATPIEPPTGTVLVHHHEPPSRQEESEPPQDSVLDDFAGGAPRTPQSSLPPSSVAAPADLYNDLGESRSMRSSSLSSGGTSNPALRHSSPLNAAVRRYGRVLPPASPVRQTNLSSASTTASTTSGTPRQTRYGR